MSTAVNSACFQATFKRYQMEHKMKQDSLDRSHSELKKLRRKSQGKNANKYELKENEVRGMQTLYADVTLQNELCPCWRGGRCWSALREVPASSQSSRRRRFFYGLPPTPCRLPRTRDLV